MKNTRLPTKIQSVPRSISIHSNWMRKKIGLVSFQITMKVRSNSLSLGSHYIHFLSATHSPVLLYNVTVIRSWEPYEGGYITVQCVYILQFCCACSCLFCADHHRLHSSLRNFTPISLHIKMMLNFVGFAAFWLPPICGERMSLSITSMLATLASDIVIAEKCQLQQR